MACCGIPPLRKRDVAALAAIMIVAPPLALISAGVNAIKGKKSDASSENKQNDSITVSRLSSCSNSYNTSSNELVDPFDPFERFVSPSPPRRPISTTTLNTEFSSSFPVLENLKKNVALIVKLEAMKNDEEKVQLIKTIPLSELKEAFWFRILNELQSEEAKISVVENIPNDIYETIDFKNPELKRIKSISVLLTKLKSMANDEMRFQFITNIPEHELLELPWILVLQCIQSQEVKVNIIQNMSNAVYEKFEAKFGTFITTMVPDDCNEIYVNNTCNDTLSKISKDSKKEVIHTCGICMNNSINAIFVPCGHTGCNECLNKLLICHICRQPFERIIKIYY